MSPCSAAAARRPAGFSRRSRPRPGCRIWPASTPRSTPWACCDSAGRPLQACMPTPHRAVRCLRGGGRAAGGADLGPGHRAQRHALRQHQARRRRASAGADGAGRLNGCVLRPSVVFGAGGASSQLFLALARLPALLLPRPVSCRRACSPWPCATWRTWWRAWRVRMRRRAWSRSAGRGLAAGGPDRQPARAAAAAWSRSADPRPRWRS